MTVSIQYQGKILKLDSNTPGIAKYEPYGVFIQCCETREWYLHSFDSFYDMLDSYGSEKILGQFFLSEQGKRQLQNQALHELGTSPDSEEDHYMPNMNDIQAISESFFEEDNSIIFKNVNDKIQHKFIQDDESTHDEFFYSSCLESFI